MHSPPLQTYIYCFLPAKPQISTRKEPPPPLRRLKSSPILLSCWWGERSPFLPFTGHTQHHASFILLRPGLSHLATSELREISTPPALQHPHTCPLQILKPFDLDPKEKPIQRSQTQSFLKRTGRALYPSRGRQPALFLMCFLHLITRLVKAKSKHGDHAEHLLAILGEPELPPASSHVLSLD